MKSRFVLRDEFFGGTLYDRERMVHRFICKKDMQQGKISWDKTHIAHYERWKGKMDGVPTEIIYSPIRIYFELTTRCNLRCRHCFVSAGKSRPSEMTLNEVCAVLGKMREDNVFDVRFTGGEPTQRPDWFQILKCAKDLGLVASLNTNGIYSSSKIYDQLALLDLEQITLSLEGSRELHDSVRGPGTYRSTLESLRELAIRGCRLRINTVVTKETPREVEQILDVASRFVSEINFFYMRPIGRGADMADDLISYEELDRLNNTLDSIKGQYPDLNILYRSTSCLKRSAVPVGNEVGLDLVGCPAGLTRFGIASDGSMYACCYFAFVDPGTSLGLVQENDFSVLGTWRHSAQLWQFRLDNMKQALACAVCAEHWSRCPGACMAMEMAYTQDSSKGNPFCIHRD